MKIKAYVKWYSKGRPYPAALVAGLKDFDVEIVEDSIGQGSATTAMRAWARGGKADATHIMVFDDDVILAKNFTSSIARAVAARPDHALNFIWIATSGIPGWKYGRQWDEIFAAAKRQQIAWVDQNVIQFGPTVLLPRALAKDFPEWCAKEINPSIGQWDDLWMRLFLLSRQRHFTQSVPCPVLHDPAMLSFSGLSPNKFRQGENFVEDAATINWDTPSLSFLDNPRLVLWDQRAGLTVGGETWRTFNLG